MPRKDTGCKRFFGQNLRLLSLADRVVEDGRNAYLNDGQAIHTRTRRAGDFCQDCQSCSYRNSGCELIELRQKAESSGRGSDAAH